MLEELIKHESVVSFCDNIKRFSLNKHAKLCGVDYFLENLAFKLYIELNNLPTEEQCKLFLQDESSINLFLQNLPYWNSKRESGLAFGIKIDNFLNVRTNFHIKFDENYVFENPNDNLMTRFKLLGINLDNKPKGMSVEYNLNTKDLVVKNYYYIENKIEAIKILGFENIQKNSFNLIDLEELEIYTTPTQYKINIVRQHMHEDVMNHGHLTRLHEQEVYKMVPIEYHEKLKTHSNIMNLSPYFVGLTSDKKRTSVYFCLNQTPNNFLGI